MTQPTTAAPITSASCQPPPAPAAHTAIFILSEAALIAGSTALAAGIFTTISPLGGAIFGASGILGVRLIDWICDKVNCCPDSMVARVAKATLPLIGGFAAAALVTTIAGFPLTFTAGAILTAATIAIPFAEIIAIGACAIPIIAIGLAHARPPGPCPWMFGPWPWAMPIITRPFDLLTGQPPAGQVQGTQ